MGAVEEEELRVENAALKVECEYLRGRSVEDRHDDERRLDWALGGDLEREIIELREELAKSDAVIDRICVFFRKRNEGL